MQRPPCRSRRLLRARIDRGTIDRPAATTGRVTIGRRVATTPRKACPRVRRRAPRKACPRVHRRADDRPAVTTALVTTALAAIDRRAAMIGPAATTAELLLVVDPPTSPRPRPPRLPPRADPSLPSEPT